MFEGMVEVPRIRHGSRQTLETLIIEEALLLAKYLRGEKKLWTPRTTSTRARMVWLEYTETGTHKGEFHGIPATNKKFEYQAVMIFDFEAGKVKLWKLYLDLQRAPRRG